MTHITDNTPLAERVYLKSPDFKRWRQFAMIKQGSAAFDIGCSQGMYARYENGEAPLALRDAEKLVQVITDELASCGLPTPDSGALFHFECPTMQSLLQFCAAHAGFSMDEIKGRSRKARINDARQWFMYAASARNKYRAVKWSWCQIARVAGRSDHTTALSGARAYAERHNLPAPEDRIRKPCRLPETEIEC